MEESKSQRIVAKGDSPRIPMPVGEDGQIPDGSPEAFEVRNTLSVDKRAAYRFSDRSMSGSHMDEK